MMPVIETLATCLTVLNVAEKATRIFDWFSGVSVGDQLKQSLAELERTKADVRRLSEHVLYSPSVQQVFNLSGTSSLMNDEKQLDRMLSPLSESLGTELLSTAVVSTPVKLKEAFRKDPWEVLVEVRPVARAKRPSNPDLIPIVFSDEGLCYVGWQTQGAVPILFGCEFTGSVSDARVATGSHNLALRGAPHEFKPVWTPESQQHGGSLPEREILRLPAVKRWLLWSHTKCEVIVTTKRLKFVDHEDSGYSFDLALPLDGDVILKRNIMNEDLAIIFPNQARYEIGFYSDSDREILIESIADT
jgi:hypothetical protein